jgi:hypothetical protein
MRKINRIGFEIGGTTSTAATMATTYPTYTTQPFHEFGKPQPHPYRLVENQYFCCMALIVNTPARSLLDYR